MVFWRYCSWLKAVVVVKGPRWRAGAGMGGEENELRHRLKCGSLCLLFFLLWGHGRTGGKEAPYVAFLSVCTAAARSTPSKKQVSAEACSSVPVVRLLRLLLPAVSLSSWQTATDLPCNALSIRAALPASPAVLACDRKGAGARGAQEKNKET